MALFKSDPVIVLPFGGYANDTKIHAQARVLEDEQIKFSESDRPLKNFWNSIKRLESDEIKFATVRARWNQLHRILVSDNEGYIFIDDVHGLDLTNEGLLWIPLIYELIEDQKITHVATTEIMKPGLTADYGVISDLDDTILHTGVTSTLKWRVLINSLFKNSYQRMPFEGSQAFYTKLHLGKSGNNSNPFFYLSNSPWNFYEYLYSFLIKFNFPKGTLLLRDINIRFKRKSSFMEGNKFKKVVHILETYPSLPFILIGDAGEHDIDIYLKVAQLFPDRVLAIYIRSVSRSSNMRRIAKMMEDKTGIEICLVQNTEHAMNHALKKRFIIK